MAKLRHPGCRIERYRIRPISINKAPMEASLLGMTFLTRLEAYEFRGGRLFLKWRG